MLYRNGTIFSKAYGYGLRNTMGKDTRPKFSVSMDFPVPNAKLSSLINRSRFVVVVGQGAVRKPNEIVKPKDS